MSDRPDLKKDLDSKIFRSYYYLKEELAAFCRAEGLPVSGGKKELTERIASYLDEIGRASCRERVLTSV